MIARRLLVFTLISATALPLAAQETFLFDSLTTEEGLSLNSVRDIVQDRLGFLWFATEDGLSRYDGYSFVTFKNDPGQPNSLSDNWIYDILLGRDGLLWIATRYGGLCSLDPETLTFTRYLVDSIHPSSRLANSLETMHEDGEGRLWLEVYGSFGVFDPRTETFVRYDLPAGEPRWHELSLTTMAEDGQGNLWLGTARGGLAKFDRHNRSFTRYQRRPEGLGSNFIADLAVDFTGVLWVATMGGGLYRYSADIDRFLPFRLRGTRDDLNSHNIRALVASQDGGLWIASVESDIDKLDPKSGRVTHYGRLPRRMWTKPIYSLYEDRAGVLWIGTDGGGVGKLVPRRAAFRHWPSIPGQEGTHVKSIFATPSGMLWVGTKDGSVWRVDGSFQKDAVLSYRVRRIGEEAVPVTVVHEDRHGDLWIGTNGDGVHRIAFDGDLEGESRARRIRLRATEPLQRVRTIYEDRSGGIWVGTKRGLFKFDGKEQLDFSGRFPDVKCMLQDSRGRFWLGTDGGLYRIEVLDGLARVLETYEHGDAATGLSSNQVRAIHEDGQGTLWIGTRVGLNRFDGATFTRYTEENGLVSNLIHDVVGDSAGALWLTAAKGLTRFDPHTGAAVNYGRSDGLLNSQLEIGTPLRADGGELFFGGVDGIDAFDPQAIGSNPFKPAVVVTRLKRFGEDVELKTDVAYSEEVVFNHKENHFSAEFAALDYTRPQDNQYSYMLEGVDPSWVYAGDRREVMYNNLAPGLYTLRVRASNNDGLWNEEGATLKIRVVPALWQTVWFRWVGVTLLVFLVLAVHRFRTHSLRAAHEEMEKRVEVRTQELREVNRQLRCGIEERYRMQEEADRLQGQLLQAQKMEAIGTLAGGVAHDFNNLLTVIQGNLELASLQAEGEVAASLREIGRASDRATALVRQLLLFARKQPLSLACVDVNNAVRSVAKMVERVIGENIVLRCDLDPELWKMRGDAGNLEQVIMNLVVNSREAMPQGGEIRIATRNKKLSPIDCGHAAARPGEFACLTVSDNGIGVAKKDLEHIFEPFFSARSDKKGTGLGLAVIFGIVEQHKGWLEVESEVGHGTTFSIYIPAFHGTEDRVVSRPSKVVPVRGDGERVLVVEDEEDVRLLVCKFLEDNGYAVVAAETVSQARSVFARQGGDFRLVFSDVMLPDGNGLDLVEELREVNPRIAVLLGSGYTDWKSRWSDIEEKGFRFLHKPYTLRQLLEVVRRTIDRPPCGPQGDRASSRHPAPNPMADLPRAKPEALSSETSLSP